MTVGLPMVDQLLDKNPKNGPKWSSNHPNHWTTAEVLDWIYCVADEENLSNVSGESFNDLIGSSICDMSEGEFLRRDKRNGSVFFNHLKYLLHNVDFQPPQMFSELQPIDFAEGIFEDGCLVDLIKSGIANFPCDENENMEPEDLRIDIPKTVLDFDCNTMKDELQTSQCSTFTSLCTLTSQPTYSSTLPQELPKQVMTQTWLKDLHHHNWKRPVGVASKIGSNWLSRTAPNDRSSPISSAWKQKCPPPRLPVGEKNFGGKSGGGKPVGKAAIINKTSQGQQQPRLKSKRGRKPGQLSKGPHLWEFVRDLLKDDRYNPRVIRWEDESEGVFRVTESKTISKLWGEHKKNDHMTYEKFSRSMRFCRTEGYFSEVPRDGRFARKLIFKFGPKSHGWKRDETA